VTKPDMQHSKEANQKRDGPLRCKLLFPRWKQVTVSDIKIVIAAITRVWCKNLSLWDYWSNYPILQTCYSISTGIFRDQFLAILIMLQTNNNKEQCQVFVCVCVCVCVCE
jgi:hypothetical protein